MNKTKVLALVTTILTIVLLSLYVFNDFIFSIGLLFSGVGYIFAALIRVGVNFLIIAAFIVAFILKKENIIKVLFSIMLIGLTYDAFRTFQESLTYFNTGNAMVIIFALADFALLFMIGLGGIFYLITYLFPKLAVARIGLKFYSIAVVVFSLFTGLLFLISAIVYKESWNTVFYMFSHYVFFIPLMMLVYNVYIDPRLKAYLEAKEAKQEVKKEEEVHE